MPDMLQIKRIYDEPQASDGTRILVDRLWPRGMSKERAALDLWLKNVAPSPGLRAWFGHKPDRFLEFKERYMDELAANSAVTSLKKLLAKTPNTTLLYAAKDPAINHAAVLKEYLETTEKK